ncbi:MAG: rRNA maturation RNase YbeY [Nitrospinota bacterium]|nr:rRNA maturation RNase YbeY [Nitrospinota bacterium]
MNIYIENDQTAVDLDIPLIENICKSILLAMNREEGEVGLLFIDNKGIRVLNKEFRNIDKVTDVLSFSQIEGDFPNLTPNLLGDVVISTEKAKEQAAERGEKTVDEITFLIIHGMLHLVGFDHLDSQEGKEAMRKKEKEIFAIIKEKHLEA